MKRKRERIEKNAPIQNGNDLFSMKIINIHLLGTEEEELEMRTGGKGREEKKKIKKRRKKRRKRKGEGAGAFFLVRRTNE